MRVLAFLTVLAATFPSWAQTRPESAPETRPGIAAVGPLMERMRAGERDVENARAVVVALLASEHVIAAPWWLTLVSERDPDAKLLPAERETLAKLKRAVEDPGTFAAERQVMLLLIRQTESLVASKDYDAARLLAAGSRAFLGIIPDPGLSKLLEAAEKKIPPPKSDDVGKKPIQSGAAADAADAYRRLIDQALAAYAEAGCRPGRFGLARSIRDAAALLTEAEVAAALDRLRGLSKTVERGSGLALFVRTVGTARFFRDGAPLSLTKDDAPFDAETHEPVDLAVVPGDVITIAFDEPYASDEIARSFVIAFHGRFESRDLGANDLACDVSDQPGQKSARLLPIPIAKKKMNPPSTLFGRGREQDEALRAFNTYFELPKTTSRSVDVPCLGDMITFLQEFETRRLAPVLIGTETRHFAIVVKVPD